MSNWNTDLMRRYGTQGPRYTSYPSALSFHEEITADDYASAIAEGNDARRPLSLYLHIPFCRSVCYYCACNRVVTADHRRASEYLQRLKKEITLRASMLDTSRPMQQIHWGGGTPTYLSDAEITELVYHTARHFHMLGDDDGEYAIEIDPRTVSANRISLLRGLGFSRVSLGVQDLDPRVQQAVNRMQPYEQIRDVFDWLRDFDFRSINTDLIYGLPWQSESSLARTIDQLVTLRPDRISLYNYAHLPARFKVQKQINELALPAPEEKLRMFHKVVVAKPPTFPQTRRAEIYGLRIKKLRPWAKQTILNYDPQLEYTEARTVVGTLRLGTASLRCSPDERPGRGGNLRC